MGILDFLKQPDVTIVQALLLKFRPVNMDVLPLYIVLMIFLPANHVADAAQGGSRACYSRCCSMS
ncbi:OpgC domain-containing protein [Streptomyces griseus]